MWTWTALDADTKLIVSWYVGDRQNEDAAAFMTDLSERLRGRIQLTTDGLGAYPNAVGLAFRHNIDFAQLFKTYASDPRTGQARYSRLSAPEHASAWTVATPIRRGSAPRTSSART